MSRKTDLEYMDKAIEDIRFDLAIGKTSNGDYPYILYTICGIIQKIIKEIQKNKITDGVGDAID